MVLAPVEHRFVEGTMPHRHSEVAKAHDKAYYQRNKVTLSNNQRVLMYAGLAQHVITVMTILILKSHSKVFRSLDRNVRSRVRCDKVLSNWLVDL
jgi:hypothetical protein